MRDIMNQTMQLPEQEGVLDLMAGPQREPRVMSDGEMVSHCMDEIANTIQGNSGTPQEIQEALKYFNGELPALIGEAAKDPKVSRTVSMDIQNGVLGALAKIMPSFLTDRLIEFEPTDEMDEQQALLESDLVQYVFMEQCNGFEIIVVGLMDALMCRNGNAKVYWDRHWEVSYQEYPRVPEMAIPQLLQPSREGEEVEIIDGEPVGVEMQQGMVDGPYGPVPIEQPIQTYRVKVRRKTPCSRPMVVSMPPEETGVASDQESIDLTDCRFVHHERQCTRSDLIADGYDEDLVYQIPRSGTPTGRTVRESAGNTMHNTSSHEATDIVTVYECYPLLDRDGDGIAERLHVVIGDGDVLLDWEEYDGMPVVSGTGIIYPHRWQGISLYDRLKQIQDSNTNMVRTIEDGTSLSARQRNQVVDNVVNMKDLLKTQTGGNVRVKHLNGMAPVPQNEVPQSAFSFLDYNDKRRRESGGGAIDDAPNQMPVGGDSAHGVERLMSSMELDDAQVAQTFAKTFLRPIFLELHRLVRKYMQGEISAKVGDRWVSSIPSQWIARDRAVVKIAPSQGERLRQAGALGGLLDRQLTLQEQGSTLVSGGTIHRITSDMTRLMGLANPEQYWVDPNSPEGQQAAQQQQQMQQQMQQKQEQVEQLMQQMQIMQTQAAVKLGNAQEAKVRSDHQNNMLKVQVEQLKAQLKQLADGAGLELDWAKLDADVALKLLEMEQNAGRQLNAEYRQNRRLN